MEIIDLHCDTLTEIEKRRIDANDPSLHFTAPKASYLKRHIQVGAIWSDSALSDDEAWERLDRVIDNYGAIGTYPILNPEDALESDRAIILAVEGARLLANDISRLDHLYERGVRILTLCWAGSDCIGGSHDTDIGLSDFGEDVVLRCFELGIIPDVSHASRKTTKRALELAESHGKCVMASHSNSYAICPHSRNLTDDEYRRITSLGGIVGISLYPPHLSSTGHASIDDIVRHITHYIELGSDRFIALGCDFDGITFTPDGIDDIRSMPRIYDALIREIGEDVTKRVFFENAYKFMQNNFIL